MALRNEMIHEARVIPLDGRAASFAGAAPVHGRYARALGRRHARRRHHELHRQDRRRCQRARVVSQRRHCISRSASRAPAPTRCSTTVTIDDPLTWTRPWTMAFPLQRDRPTACSSTPATKGTTGCATSSLPPASRKGADKEQRRPHDSLACRSRSCPDVGVGHHCRPGRRHPRGIRVEALVSDRHRAALRRHGHDYPAEVVPLCRRTGQPPAAGGVGQPGRGRRRRARHADPVRHQSARRRRVGHRR